MSELQSTGSLLPLAPGIYAFTLGEVGPVARAPGMPFPAIQLTPAPGQEGAKAEFLGTADNWLIQRGDVVVVRISGGPYTLILTTFRLAGQGLSAMPIEVRRQDQPPAPRIEAPAAVRHILRTQILTHVQRRGDIPFVGTDWAGCMGQQLWIEAFAITPLEVISPDDIEYKGVSADGWETPWTPGGNLCGARGRAVPITGFAIRLRGALAQSFECEYRGAFFNSGVVGPVRDGAPCRANDLRDPLEGIQLAIAERQRQLEPPTLQRFAAQ